MGSRGRGCELVADTLGSVFVIQSLMSGYVRRFPFGGSLLSVLEIAGA